MWKATDEKLFEEVRVHLKGMLSEEVSEEFISAVYGENERKQIKAMK